MHILGNLHVKLSFSSLCFLFLTPLCLAADRITANQTLSWNQTLVSVTGIFELGFFQPGKSNLYYVGIWYKQVFESERAMLWVANRDKPISDKYSSHLKILQGNLVLVTNDLKTNTLLWSTNLNVSTHSDNLEAVLLDSGNFVLRHRPNAHHPLWQSSDHPAHVWLPGYKIGIDKRTGTNRVLTSWTNSEDPASGLFSLRIELNRTVQFVILWNGTQKYWSSGAWNPTDQSFALLPELRNKPKNSYNFSFVDNENETYFTYYVRSHAIPSRLVMDVSGQLKSLTWPGSGKWILLLSLPEQQCEVYRYCGTFGECNQLSLPYCNCLHGFQPKEVSEWNLNDYGEGCSRQTQLQCLNSTNSKKKRDHFWENPNVALPENPQSVEVRSMKDCEIACSNNCSCTAYAYNSGGCSVWIGDLLNVKQLSSGDPDGKTLYIRLNASEFQGVSGKKKILDIILGSVIGSSAVIGLVWIIIWGQKRLSIGEVVMDGSIMQFRYKELQSATKNFSDKLGEGGFGSVFKGRLPNSSLIAVKVLEGARQGDKQFRAEVSTIGKVQHINLVRLRGFCCEGSKKLLVYEYMPNGSLNSHLFHGKNSEYLRWETRYQIAVGTAKGLVYLHEKCRDCIIHCDIKPENILLDADLCPKIADFGLAKLMGREFSRVLTSMRGTRGYLAPEWISGAAITVKADVYSYGMMLFEIISGRRNSEQVEDEEFDYFPIKALSKMSEGEDILSIVDPRLEGNADKEEAIRLCKIAAWCIQDDENQRPTMGQVVQVLEGVLDVGISPMPRSLQMFADNHSDIHFFTEGLISESRAYASATSSFTQSEDSYVTARSQG